MPGVARPRVGRCNDDAADDADGLEELTPLGTLLAKIPVDPRIGKMMLFGAIFRCLESTLVIAASLAFRSPFFSPFDKRAEVRDTLSIHVRWVGCFVSAFKHPPTHGTNHDGKSVSLYTT